MLLGEPGVLGLPVVLGEPGVVGAPVVVGVGAGVVGVVVGASGDAGVPVVLWRAGARGVEWLRGMTRASELVDHRLAVDRLQRRQLHEASDDRVANERR